jgi:hypothetical protein
MDAMEPSNYRVDKSLTGYSNHGSIVASKVVGRTFGVAKNADLMNVKWPISTPNPGQLFHTALFDGLRVISEHLKFRKQIANRPGIAVINMSFSMFITRALSDQFSDWIDQLIAMDVVIVASSSNCRIAIPPDANGDSPCPVSKTKQPQLAV